MVCFTYNSLCGNEIPEEGVHHKAAVSTNMSILNVRASPGFVFSGHLHSRVLDGPLFESSFYVLVSAQWLKSRCCTFPMRLHMLELAFL